MTIGEKRVRKRQKCTPDNDMMAFIDDDSLMDDSLKEDEPQEMSSSGMHPSSSSSFHNGWSNQIWNKRHCDGLSKNAVDPSVNCNNNNNNNNKDDQEDNDKCNTAAIDNYYNNSKNSAGNGSPLRTSLNLKLNSYTSPKSPLILDCPMCSYSSNCSNRLQEHINRQHFDLTSPSFPPESLNDRNNDNDDNINDNNDNFNCPLCIKSFKDSSELEIHVNIEHKDILSPSNGSSSNSDTIPEFIPENVIPTCPVCSSTSFCTHEELERHVEEHFSKNRTPSPLTPDSSCDRMLARDMERQGREREKEIMRLREQKEFELLRAQYGMDNQGNFCEQSVTNMQKAVFAGEMSVSDYYERQLELKNAENNGIDDGRSSTKGLVPSIKAVSQASSNVINTWMCSTVDHYASTYGDKGWGCGYRNCQMLFSCLVKHNGYNDLLYKAWSLIGGNSSSNFNGDNPSRSALPSISRIQRMIEFAWSQGFDAPGAEQLGSKLVNTRKWIGPTEVVTLLSSLRIKCKMIDFHRPTRSDGCHPELFNWVLQYFQKNDDFKPPLYLQHQGHSRTIMGVEQLKDGSIIMLVLDPSHTPMQMNQFNSTNTAPGAMRLIRKSPAAMKARQYQIVAVVGTIDSETSYQLSKVLQSDRIPNDR